MHVQSPLTRCRAPSSNGLNRALVRTIPYTTVACASLWIATAAHANEGAYFEDLPTVLTASRLPQPLNEAPGAVTVLDGDFIRATGYRDLARVFRLVPGMQVGQERGHNHSVTYHGLGNNFPAELQVLIDGRSVFSPSSFGGVDWSGLPLNVEEIDRIEIVRGPNAVTYGANAFMGVINIITRHGAVAENSYVRANFGAPGVRDLFAGGHLRQGETSLQIHGASMRDDGFAQMEDRRQTNMLSLRADYRLSAIDEVMFRLASSTMHKGEGYAGSVVENNAVRVSRYNNHLFHFKWTRSTDASNEWVANFYLNRERGIDEWTAIAPGDVPLPVNRNRTSLRTHLELQNRFRTNSALQFVWGGEVKREDVDSAFLYASSGGATTDLYRAFVSSEWRFAPNWQANIGAAYERYSGEPAHVAPRLFVNWQASAQHTLRAGAARAYQQRYTFEKEGDVRAVDEAGVLYARPYRPNSNLRQSRIDSIELGYLGQFGKGSSLDVRAFREKIDGYIYRRRSDYSTPGNEPLLEPALGSAIYVNRESPIYLSGIEYQLRMRPWRGAELLFNHAMIARDSGDSATDDRTAPYTAALTWMQNYGRGWTSMFTVLRMGPNSGGDGFVPLSDYVAKPYTTYDARVAYTSRWRGRVVEVAINAVNLGPRHQETPDRSQQAYRALFGDVSAANRASRTVFLSFKLQM